MLENPGPSDATRLREYFQASQYTDEEIFERLELQIPVPKQHSEFDRFLTRVGGTEAFDCLTRVFYLACDISKAETPFPDGILALLQSCGLLADTGDAWRPMALLTPCHELWLAADLHQQRESASGFDHVLPYNHPALTLLNFAVRCPVESTLDLCSGLAVHALSASRFSQSVVATDLNARAKMYGEFNAALNDCQNVECVTGSLFEAVEGRKFDLILSNPPFVMSPATEYVYRDNPIALDGFCRQILQAVPGYLNEGGMCQVICEWVEIEGQPWISRLAEWFDGTGCDVWILEANRQLPSSYAREWVRETAHESEESEETRFRQWNQNFIDGNVAAVCGGLIFLRRRRGENWIRSSQLARAVDRSVSDAVVSGFAARDFLQENQDDARLLEQKVRVSSDARLQQQSRWADGQWRTESAVLTLEQGIPVAVGIDDNVRILMSRMTGNKTIGEVLAGIAEQYGLDVDALQGDCLIMMRRLIEQGCLEVSF